MKKNLLRALLLTVIVLFTLGGCDLFQVRLEEDLAAESRTLVSTEAIELTEDGSFIPFVATIGLQQDPLSVITKNLGNGQRFKTEEETIYGQVMASDWTALAGAQVVMHNKTNYSLQPSEPFVIDPETGYSIDTYLVDGTNHSEVTLYLADGSALSLKANGSLAGNIPLGAELDMNFTTVGKSDVRLHGRLNGTFYWVTTPPSGIITLSGYYRQ